MSDQDPTSSERADHLSADAESTGTDPSGARFPGVQKTLAPAITTFKFAQQTRIARATIRYLVARGPILAAGTAYMALFSLTAALTVGWSLFSFTLRDQAFKDSVIEAANLALPGLFRSESFPAGLVTPDSLVATSVTSVTGIIALGITLFTATKVVNYLTRSIRSMFGLGNIDPPIIQAYLRRFLGLLALLLGLFSTVALTSLATFLKGTVDRWLESIGQSAISTLFPIGTVLIPLMVDFVLFIVLVRFVALVRPMRKDLLMGAAITAAGSTALRVVGTSALTHVSGPVLTAATTLITLTLWINLLITVTLFAAAFTANPPLPAVEEADAYHNATSIPNFITLSDPKTLEWNGVGVASGEALAPPE